MLEVNFSLKHKKGQVSAIFNDFSEVTRPLEDMSRLKGRL